MLKKLLGWLHNLTIACDAPYECPWCMHCYNSPSELPDPPEMTERELGLKTQ